MIKTIHQIIDLDSYRNEAQEAISIKLEDADAEIAPVPAGKVGHIVEPEMDLLSKIIMDFNDKNIVFADTLETIDNIILFSISNYFLRFSNEYKRVHGIQDFDNNWYEYVEYGTVNPLTIWLQRNGFTREVATYIRANRTDYLNIDSEGNWTISRKLLHCSNEKAKNEAINVLYNMQEIFEPEN